MTLKFSQFVDGGELEAGETIVGLNNLGQNTKFTMPDITITSTGEGYSLVYTESAPDMILKGFTAGAGITIVDNGTNLQITNSSPASDISDATFVTLRDETSVLPNSFPLAMHATGFVASTTGTGNIQMRTHTGTTNQITVTDGNGLSGNPTYSLPEFVALPGALQVNGDLEMASSGGIFSFSDLVLFTADGTEFHLTIDYITSNKALKILNTIFGDSQITTSSGDFSITPAGSFFVNTDNGDVNLFAGVGGGTGSMQLLANGTGNVGIQANLGNIYLDSFSGSIIAIAGGSNILTITPSGVQIGSGSTVDTISNSASASSATSLMTANAVQLAIANQVSSAKSFRGGYNASTNLFPSTGGSGPAGVPYAGDVWVVTTPGTLGGTYVDTGATLLALVNTPGQTSSNWAININGVASWNSRTGVVVPADNDYPYNYITGLPDSATSGKLMRGTGSAWAETTASFADTYAVNTLLYAGSADNVSGLATANSSMLTTNGSGVPGWRAISQYNVLSGDANGAINNIAPSTAGYVLTSNGASAQPTFQAPAAPGIAWSTVTGTTQTAVAYNGYIANNAGVVTVTLPTTAAVGDTFSITGINNATGWKLAVASGQTLYLGTSATTTSTGYLQSTNTRDAVTVICTVANTTFQVISSIGNITVG